MIRELIYKAQRGDKESMNLLIIKFKPLLQKYARKLEREDAYEDFVLSFIELVISIKLESFAECGDGIFVSYIQVSIKNYYKKFLEKLIKEKNMVCLSELSEEQKYYVDAKLARFDEGNILDELDARNILSKKEYEVIYLIYFGGFTAAGIARITCKTRQSVNQIKKRALKKLKDSLVEKT